MSNPVDDRVAKLLDLDGSALRQLWDRTFTHSAPKHISRGLLLHALAHRLQEQAEGGLSKAALKRLGHLASPEAEGSRMPMPVTRLRAGTRLVREWRGETHQVAVLDQGFDYRGARFSSLSQIARQITGTRWSGPLFFGLRKTPARPQGTMDEH